MKKFLLFFLTVALLLPTLLSCAAERYDLLYETTVDSLTYRVRGSGTRAKQIAVVSDDTVIWTKKIKVSKSVGSQNGTYGFEVLDLNFDGKPDFMIANDIAGDCIAYTCWLWDESSQKYQKSEELSGLCNIKADAELSAIFAFTHTYETVKSDTDMPDASIACDSATKYEWANGKLIPSVRASITFYSESNLYCYSLSYYDESLGKLGASDDKWLTPEEYAQYDMRFLYYFK